MTVIQKGTMKVISEIERLKKKNKTKQTTNRMPAVSRVPNT